MCHQLKGDENKQVGHQLKGDAFKQVGHQLKGECFWVKQLIVYFLRGGAGRLQLMWSPKRMTLLWFSGVCEGYPGPDCVFFFGGGGAFF